MDEIYIPSSQVSAICGRNIYASSSGTVVKVLAQYNSGLFNKVIQAFQEDINVYKHEIAAVKKAFPVLTEFLDSHKNLTYYHQIVLVSTIDVVRDFLNKQPERYPYRNIYTEDQIIDQCHQHICRYSKLPTRIIAQNTVSATLKDQLMEEIKSIVPTAFQKAVFQRTIMDRGTKKEREIFDRLGTQFNLDVTYDNTHIYKIFVTEKGNSYKLGGRIDAYFPDGVLEIKTRLNQLLGAKNMNSYDIDQLAAYAVLTDRRCFGICEFYNGNIEITYYDKDELLDRFSVMKTKLDAMVDWLSQVDKNPFDHTMFEMLSQHLYMTVNSSVQKIADMI